MHVLAQYFAGKILSGGPGLPYNFRVVFDPVTREVTPVAVSQVISGDRIYSRATGPQTVTDYHISLEDEVINTFAEVVTVESLHPVVATIDRGVLVKHQSPGSATIRIATPHRRAEDVVVAFAVNTPVVDMFVGFASGSLARHASDQIDDLIGGLEPATDGSKPVYTTQDHATPVYVRNPGCWAEPIDLTGVSPWNSYDGPRRAGVAITRRHVVFAAHYPLQAGSTIRFVTSNNEVVTRTVAGVSVDGATDIGVARLDADLPGTIRHYSVLPANYAAHLPGALQYMALLAFDQEEKCLVMGGGYITADGVNAGGIDHDCQNYAQRLKFNEGIISGDSGNPVFMVVSGVPVLLTAWWTSFGGPNYAAHIAQINSMITTLGGGGTLSTVDLSNFNTY
ncbi:MAG: hypothetical protein SFY80_03140 [Verrucomicrobiota bacterium]|nr:hypothetical protein [Verrucomicrobiota bacterium]